MNLSWQLAAVVQGWAPVAILDAYEAERQPITERVSRHAMNHAVALAKLRSAVPAEIDDAGAAGAAARARVGRELYDLNVSQYCCGGLNFGYFYDASPVIAYDDASPPGYSMYNFTPSTVPGCRTPHLWLRDGRSLYDALGSYYTLIRTDPSVPADALLAAAAQRRMPIALLDLDAPEGAALYPRKFVLSRPDQHVAWRGDAVPPDPLALIDHIRGAGSSRCRKLDGWRGRQAD